MKLIISAQAANFSIWRRQKEYNILQGLSHKAILEGTAEATEEKTARMPAMKGHFWIITTQHTLDHLINLSYTTVHVLGFKFPSSGSFV